MGKKKSNQKQSDKELRCIVYLSVNAGMQDVEYKEDKQLRYISDYAKAHNLIIQKIIRRSILGQAEVNKHFRYMIQLIHQGKVDAIVVGNIMAVAANVVDAYAKVGSVVEAGGAMITVDEGGLDLKIKGGEHNGR